MKGKSYNRGIRAHKLTMEALFRLKWNAFLTWYAEHADDTTVNKDIIKKKAEECQLAISVMGEVQTSVDELQKETKGLQLLVQDFGSEGRAKSKMFTFWEK